MDLPRQTIATRQTAVQSLVQASTFFASKWGLIAMFYLQANSFPCTVCCCCVSLKCIMSASFLGRFTPSLYIANVKCELHLTLRYKYDGLFDTRQWIFCFAFRFRKRVIGQQARTAAGVHWPLRRLVSFWCLFGVSLRGLALLGSLHMHPFATVFACVFFNSF